VTLPRTSSHDPGWSPKLVALDVDGTLIRYEDFHAPPSPDVTRAVAAVVAAGVPVVVSTGRSLHSTVAVFDHLGLRSGLAVCSNGAVVVDLGTRTPVHVETFDALAPVRYFVDHVPDAVLAVEELGVGFRVTPGFADGAELDFDGHVTVVQHDELVQGPVTRLVVRWPNGDREQLRTLAEEMGLPAVDYAIGYSAWLDIMPAGISKASGLEKVGFALGVAADDVLAVGDGTNDLEMLRWAGLGVAMGNAPDEVKAAADEVAGDVDDDGVATLLARWF
jgi:Cof subfamily protein (haloacid dehalogenase superfamily)